MRRRPAGSAGEALERVLARYPWLPPLLLLSAAFGIHEAILGFGSVEWEDFCRMFSGSRQDWWSRGIWFRLFSPAYFSLIHANNFYRPLTTIYYHLGWLLFGSRIAPYQASKVTVLWIISLLIFQLSREWLGGRRWALAAGLLYLAHPFHARMLFRLSYVDDLFATFFCLLALWLHAGGAGRGGWAGAARRAGVVACYALALLSKEVGVVLPGLLLLYDAVFSRARLDRWTYAALAMTLAGYGLMLSWVGRDAYSSFILPAPDPLWLPLNVLSSYLHWLLPWTEGSAPAGAAALFSAVSWVALLAWVSDGSARQGLFYGGWVVLGLLPVLDVVTSTRMVGYLGHPTYTGTVCRLALPAVGLAWLFAACLHRLAAGWRREWSAIAAAVILFGAQARATAALEVHSRDTYAAEVISGAFLRPGYRIRESRLMSVLLSLPAYRKVEPAACDQVARTIRRALPGHEGPTVADLFSSDRIYSETERYLDVAQALADKGFWKFHRDLNDVYQQNGRDSALAADLYVGRITKAFRLKDDGVRKFLSGDPRGADLDLRESLRLNPDNLLALLSHGAMLAQAGRFREAVREYDHALDLGTADGDLRALLLSARGTSMDKMGLYSASKADLSEADAAGSAGDGFLSRHEAEGDGSQTGLP